MVLIIRAELITKKIKNTPSEWRGLYSELFDKGGEKNDSAFTVEVELFRDARPEVKNAKQTKSEFTSEPRDLTTDSQYIPDGDSDEIKGFLIDEKDPDPSHVLELSHFFPLADRLLLKGKRVTLKVLTRPEDERIKDLVKRFVLAQSKRFSSSRLIMRLNDESLNSGWLDSLLIDSRWRAIPLISVCYDTTTQDVPFSALQQAGRLPEGKANAQLSILYRICDRIKTDLENEKKYVGTKLEQISRENKTKLASEVKEQLKRKRLGTPFLTYIIWLLLLRNLLEDKELMHPIRGILGSRVGNEETKKAAFCWELDKQLIETSFLNAEAYAEGLLQLLENACLYSAAKRGYFCLMPHRIGLSGGLSDVGHHAETAQKLYDRYRNCFMASERASQDNLFAKNYRYLLEFYALDDAGEEGIGIRLHEKIANKHDYSCLEGILHAHPDFPKDSELKTHPQKLTEYAEQVADHYGLRLFSMTVTSNDGYFMVQSPYSRQTDTLYVSANRTNRADPKAEQETVSYLTQFRCLVPLCHEPDGERDEPQTIGDIFEAPDGGLPFWTTCMAAKPVIRGLREHLIAENEQTPLAPSERKTRMSGWLAEEIAKSQIKPENAPEALAKDRTILAIDARELAFSEVELLAKALFRYTVSGFQLGQLSADVLPVLRIAVLFKTERVTSLEFIRLLLSFYDKLSIREDACIRKILKRLQLAVCTQWEDDPGKAQVDGEDKEDRHRVSVGFILSGDDHRSAYLSARNYLYMNFETSLEFLPVLRYFTHGEGKDRKNEKQNLSPLFRFDLHLSKASFDVKETDCKLWKETTPLENSLFLDRMKEILNTPLSEHDREGCKIEGIHMRINSRLHLNCFYEAELLFRSIGNVYGFAGLVAGELLQTLPGKIKTLTEQAGKTPTVALVGYEKLSTELVLQIAEWIKGKIGCSLRVRVIPVAGRKERKWIKLAAFDKKGTWQEENDEVGLDESTEEEDAPQGDVVLVSVIPIGCTYSNVYKIRNVAREKWKHANILKNDPDICTNYSIIAVNSKLKPEDAANDITWAFWDHLQAEPKKLIYLTPEIDGQSGATVRYYLPANADWHTPNPERDPKSVKDGEACLDICPMCKDLSTLSASLGDKTLLPLLQLDRTSTIPESTFLLKNRRSGLVPHGSPLEDKTLEKLKGTFQYGHICKENNHFQFRFDLRQVYSKNKNDVVSWLQAIEIEQTAFHIVIAPADIEGMPFVGAALREVFHNSLHFLHIDLNQALREDIRLKFSHIAYEYQELRRRMPSLHIRFYFVDEGIVSTQSISRARLLAQMLLNEGGLNSGESFFFSKVILLMCRSSPDTLQQFVADPEKDVKAWITLNFPPYNTQADRCPACNLQETYSLLRKRAATDLVSEMFKRLEDKQQKRTPEEFSKWLHNEILDNHSYYSLFKEWLAMNTDGDKILADPSPLTPEEAALFKDAFKADMLTAQNRAKKYAEMLREEIRQDEKLREILVKDKQRKIWFREALEKYTLRKLWAEEPKISEDRLVKVVMATVVTERNYRRLYCTQRAYEKLILHVSWNENSESRCYDDILELINSKLKSVKEEKEKKKQDYSMEAAEWLISYIKVISREHRVRHYHVRKAIVNVMYDLMKLLLHDELDTLTGKLTALDSWAPIYSLLGFRREGDVLCKEDAGLCHSLRYELFMTLVHRLSVLQCNIVLQKDYRDAAMNYCKKLAVDFFREDAEGCDPNCLIELPSEEAMRNRYVKSIKTATMLTTDDAPAYQIARAFGIESGKEAE